MVVAHLTLFGKFELRLADGKLLDLPGQKDRAVLAILALSRGAALSRDKLTGLLWGDRGDVQARDSLKHALKHIRHVLGDALAGEAKEGLIIADRNEVRLAPDCIDVDAITFEHLIRKGTPEALEQASRLCGGEFLDGIAVRDAGFEAWLLAERQRLRRLQEHGLTKLLAPALDTEIRECAARSLLELDPTREAAARVLMQIHVERGEGAQALRLFEALRERLQGDLGAKPEQETLETYESIRAGRLRTPGSLSMPLENPSRETQATSVPDLLGKPSIAVLPFENMSGDPEQNYFADGIAEDIITDLSRLGRLFVIARNSSFTYRNRVVDAKTIGQELGVRYILEGSVRKVANRVRITGQLIDTATGTHLWAQRFDGDLENVFALQDEVTAKIVEELLGRLTMPPPRARPKNMDAYELCVRVRSLVELSSQDSREGMLMVQRAVTLDPDYAEAHALLAHCHWMAWMHWGQPMVPHRELAMTTAKKAIALDPNDACCRWILGNILACERQWKESEKEFATALMLDPNNADTWACLSDMSVLAGQAARGLEQIRKAFRFNPYPPNWYFCLLGQAQYAARDYVTAVETLRREETYRTGSRRFLAASLAQLGQLDEAQREAELYLVNNPYFTISHWVSSQPIRDEATRDHFVEGFRKASLPD